MPADRHAVGGPVTSPGKEMPHSRRISSITRRVATESGRGLSGVWSRPASMRRATSAASKCGEIGVGRVVRGDDDGVDLRVRDQGVRVPRGAGVGDGACDRRPASSTSMSATIVTWAPDTRRCRVFT